MLNKIAHVDGVFPFFTTKPGPCVAVRRDARIDCYFHQILALSGVSRSRSNLPKTEGVQRDHFSSLVGSPRRPRGTTRWRSRARPRCPAGHFGLVEDDAKHLQMLRHQRADKHGVLTDPAGKHHAIQTVQGRGMTGDMPRNPVDKGLYCQPRPLVAVMPLSPARANRRRYRRSPAARTLC